MFHDDSSLSANPGLWSSVASALDASGHLVLLASPAAAASEWVGKEIEHWRAHHDPGLILLVLTEGKIAWGDGDFDFTVSSALPTALSGAFVEEPRYVDLTWVGRRAHLSPRDPRFRDAVADIAAVLHGRPKDDLVGDDVRQHRRARRLAAGGTACLAALAMIASTAAILALRSRDQAESRQLAAEAMASLEIDPQRSVELATAGYDRWATTEARDALDEARIESREVRLLRGHAGPVDAVAFGRTGGTLITAGEDGTVRLWREGARAPTVIHACLRCVAASVSPEGTTVAVADSDGTISPIDTESGDRAPLLARHTGVTSLVFLGDSLLASGGTDGRLRLWRITGRGLALAGSATVPAAIGALAASPDRVHVAAGRQDGQVSVWEARPGGRLTTLGAARDRITSVAFTRSGRRVVAGSQDRTALVWDLGHLAGAPIVLRGQEGLVATVSAGGSERVATAGSGGTARVWDARTGRLIFTLQGHTGLVVRARFSFDGRRLATAANDGTVRVWDARTGGLRAVLAGHRSNVRDVAFAPDGASVATGAFDGTARVWDIDRGGSTADLVGNRGSVTSVAFSEGMDEVVTTSFDGTIRVWATGRPRPTKVIDAGRSPLQAAGLDPTGRYLAVGDHAGASSIWDLRTGMRSLFVGDMQGIIFDVRFDRDGRRVATVGEDGRVTVATRLGPIWNQARIEDLARTSAAAALTLAFDPVGRGIATAGKDGRVRLYLGERNAPRVWLDQNGPIFTITYSPDGSLIATGGSDGVVRLRDAATGRLRRVFRGHVAPVAAVRFSPFGDRIVSASQDGTAAIWGVADGRRLAVLSAHTAPVLDAVFTPSGREVVTVSEDGSARVWGSDGRRLARLSGARAAVISVAISCDGRRLATGSSDAVARLYDLPYDTRMTPVWQSGVGLPTPAPRGCAATP